MKIKSRLLALGVFMAVFSSINAQDVYHSGAFALGIRNTVNVFQIPNQLSTGIGAGGQFKVGFGSHVNTEFFYDYITSRPVIRGFRQDHHIGWSVQFNPFEKGFGSKAFVPYFLGGQCFDLTRLRTQKGNVDLFDSGQIFSAAVQVGLGVSKFIGNRLEMTFQTQYMVHLGKDVHFETTIGPYISGVTVHNETNFAGHLLFTLAANYYLFDLWKN